MKKKSVKRIAWIVAAVFVGMVFILTLFSFILGLNFRGSELGEGDERGKSFDSVEEMLAFIQTDYMSQLKGRVTFIPVMDTPVGYTLTYCSVSPYEVRYDYTKFPSYEEKTGMGVIDVSFLLGEYTDMSLLLDNEPITSLFGVPYQNRAIFQNSAVLLDHNREIRIKYQDPNGSKTHVSYLPDSGKQSEPTPNPAVTSVVLSEVFAFRRVPLFAVEALGSAAASFPWVSLWFEVLMPWALAAVVVVLVVLMIILHKKKQAKEIGLSAKETPETVETAAEDTPAY